MSRICGAMLLAGIGLIVMGAYDFFIQMGASRTPTTVSIVEMEKAIPSNRHLIITGGKALTSESVVYYKRRNHSKVQGSEVYFIPIQDATIAAYPTLTPTLLVRITEQQMKKIQNTKSFNSHGIQGVRMTHWDLETKAEDLLAKRYGFAAVKRMVVLDYEKKVTGVVTGLSQMSLGVVCCVGSIVLAGLTSKGR